MTEFLQKNKKEILIIFGTIILSYFLVIELVSYLFRSGVKDHDMPMAYYYFLLFFAGLFSAVLSAIVGKNIKKALIVGIITTIVWYIFYFIMAWNGYRVH